MIYVLIPFAVFAVFAAVMIWLMQRNIRRSTRMRGTVTGKHYVPAHGGFEPGARSTEHVISVPDSWVLDIEGDGRRGNAVVSQAEFDQIRVGDVFDGDPQWQT